jgi:CRISPR-associated endonuclease/helicase Cas3
MNFADFFRQATRSNDHDGNTPYRYQEQFATAPVLPHLLRVPTGSGKTRAMGLGWLWRLLHGFPQTTPRRLVYCLPMRVLVEQSHRESSQWLKNLGLDDRVGLHLLMGGAESRGTCIRSVRRS